MATHEKPLLLFTSFPLAGHTQPLLKIAAFVIKQGYEVTFIAAKEFEPAIVAMGATFVATPGVMELVPPDWFAQRESRAIGYERILYDHQTVMMSGIVQKTQIVDDTLVEMRGENPNRQIIMVLETFNQGVLPFKYGRPPPKGFDLFPKTIGVNTLPMYIQGVDVGPFLMALPPDSTPSGRLRNQALNKLYNESPFSQALTRDYNEKYFEAGATRLPEGFPGDAWVTSWDVTLQLCSPSMEYPMSDLPSNVVFTGCLPLVTPEPAYRYPDWWSDVVENHAKKKIVFVAQGTVAMNLRELILPTILGVADRDDILLVTTLGMKGATLPADFVVPGNVRVADYLLYDVILPYTDVFVSNAGYGAITQSVMAGVPMVLAGESEDKMETIMRTTWAGVSWNVKTQTPTPGQIREGIDAVLKDSTFKQRVVELQKENESMNALARIEEQVVKLTE
ncbi:hypothetical protein JX266_007119 [Neoarthrinium moseri]|nr:hypothetical protein JX266_007119 [Neoarthrinium moseri]